MTGCIEQTVGVDRRAVALVGLRRGPSGLATGALAGLADRLLDQLLDLGFLLLQLAQGRAVLLLGLEGHRLRVLATPHQALDAFLGVQRLLGEALHLDQVLCGLLAPLGDLGGGRLDLVLVDLEQHLGGVQVVVLVALQLHQRAVRLALPGDVRRRLGVEDRREGHQVRVALLVEGGDRVDHGVTLVLQRVLAGGHIGAGLLETGLGSRERRLHLLVTLQRDLQPGTYVAQLGARLGQLLAGVRERLGGPAQRRAGLVELVVGSRDLLVHRLLAVAQLAGVGRRSGQDGEQTDADGHRDNRRGRASTTGAGEGTHLFAFGCSGK